MALQELLEVAIGLIFAWLVLSVATMQVQEWIASYLGWRAKDMENSIRNMLGDPAWAEQLYQHPIIQGLSKKAGVKPSYIPANQFAVALFDVVMTAGTDGSIIQRQLLELKAKKPKSFKEFLHLIPARWWDQVLTWFTRINNYLAGKEARTTTMIYETLLEYAGKADSSFVALKNLIDELGQADKIKKISQLYPDLDKTLKEIFRKISLRLINSKKELEQFPIASGTKDFDNLKELLDALDEYSENEDPEIYPRIITGISTLLQAKNNLEQLKKLFNINYPSQNTLDKFATSLEAIADSNPLLHKTINTLKPDIKDFAQKIEKIDEKTIGFVKEKEKHLQETRLEAEIWFNDVMERAQGWYKRKAQAWAFWIGLILALLLNVDSIALANQLWREPAVRQSFASTADKFISETNDINDLTQKGLPPEQAIAQFQKRFEGLSIPFGWDLITHNEKVACSLPAGPEQIVGFYVPFTDYDSITPGNQNICLELTNPPRNFSTVLVKFLGILISALAAMQGAPFWFDILKKLVNVRGTGANPAEKPKDEQNSSVIHSA